MCTYLQRQSYPINPAIFPLLSTSATASLALYEYIFLNSLLKASQTQSQKYSSPVARTIALWWSQSLPSGLAVILSFGLTSLITGIRTIRASPTGSTKRWIAVAGTLLATGHFAFAPRISKVIQGMAYAYERAGVWERKVDAMEAGKTEEQVAEEKALEGQREWLRVHFWRTLLTDLPAWGCFGWLVFAL